MHGQQKIGPACSSTHSATDLVRLNNNCAAGGKFIQEYVNATVPYMAFGEFWDTCEYTDGVLNYNQDGHRQRTVNWCDATGGTSAAFDFTTKGRMPLPLSSPCDLGISQLTRGVFSCGLPTRRALHSCQPLADAG